jgi:hypothetical protein
MMLDKVPQGRDGPRGLRILHMSVHHNLPPGIFRQMHDEYDAAQTLSGVRWDTRVFAAVSPREGPHLTRLAAAHAGSKRVRLAQYLQIRRLAFGWLKAHAADYDWVLIRHGLADTFEWAASRHVANWATVHHTWEPEEALLMGGLKGTFFHALERFTGDAILRRSKAVIGVSRELGRLESARIGGGKPVLCYPNGIRLDGVPLLPDERRGPPRLVFVSSVFAAWHGLELVLDALRRLPDDFLPPSAIPPLLARADIGLSSFALAQKGMAEACTLKVREYLANGLPVYAGHFDTALDDAFPYFRQHGGGDGQALLDYARAMRARTRAEVREAAAPFIDKQACMRRLADALAALPQGGP